MSDADDIPPLEDIPVNVTTTKPTTAPVVKYVVEPAQAKEKQETEKSFAGMKKGFLSGNSTSKPRSDEVVEVLRKNPEQTKDFRVLDEVQQVIKEEQQSKNSWLTNDLLKQIEDDQSLAAYFSNPFFMEAINLFQHKPQEALAKYGHNTEVMKFFDRMTKILGGHFASIADREDQQKQSKVDPEVNRLLQDEQVRQLLLDPDVVQLMKLLREQPDKAQWMMRTATASMRAKIQQLIQLGLLNVA